MSVAQSLEPSQVLDGKYALLRELGAGPSGTVYEAEHLALGKLVALKLMDRTLFANAAQRDRFVSEARAAARVGHVNVVDVHDFGLTPDGVPYVVTELVRGETLAQIIAKRGALPVSYACDLMLQVLAALSAAHAQGVVHGNLKPGNILVTHSRPDRPHIKVLDFGLSRRDGDVSANAARGTALTANYLSPEQARGETSEARSDLYSASTLFYAMLSGRGPYEADGSTSALKRVMAGDFTPLAEANPQLPKLLATLVERGLSLDPRQRVGSAEEYTELLQPFVGSGPTSSRGSMRQLMGDSLPLITAPGEITIQEYVSSPPPGGSSVIPMRVASYARGVTDSLLVTPRFPREASTPRLEPGKDFLPTPGEPGWGEATERGLPTVATVRRTGRNAWPALLATGMGFGLGVLIAWLSGAI